MATEQTEPEKKGYYTTNSRKVADFLIGFGLYLGIFMINFLISYIYSYDNIDGYSFFFITILDITSLFLLIWFIVYFTEQKRNYILIGILSAFLLHLVLIFLSIGACFIGFFSGRYF